MNILLVGPPRYNSTDGVIFKGIEYLLNLAYDKPTFYYIELKDHDHQQPFHFDILDLKMDLIVVCGTPWLWDSFQKSIKFKNLLNCFTTHSSAKRLFMGIGTCLPLPYDISYYLLRRPEEVLGMKYLFAGATVIVREPMAYTALNYANINCIHLPCPSFYCYGDDHTYNTGSQDVMVYIDPTKSISHGEWTDKVRLDAFNQTFLDFNVKYSPQVYIAKPEDRGMAEAIGLRNINLLPDVNYTLHVMKNANRVLSGRVHCAIPALVQNKEVQLIPIDTRAITLECMRGINTLAYIQDYMQVLKSI